METRIWINIVLNADCRIDGKDDFFEALRQEGAVVQERKKWYPAYGSGQEVTLIQMLLNNPYVSFAIGAVASGVFWDATKHIIRKLFDSLRNLKERNEELSIECLQFDFDDITIKAYGLLDVDYTFLQDTILDMGKHIEYLRGHNITDICEISLPYEPREEWENAADDNKYKIAVEYTKQVDCLWKIKHAYGCLECYYNPRNQEIIKC